MRENKVARVKLIDSHIAQGTVYYTITPEGIEFYLDTKEIKDESKINVSQLLLEMMFYANYFKGGIEVVRRINSQVISLIEQKEQVVKLLGVDVFEGAKAYEHFMDTTAKWFTEEQKLFVKNKALVDKAIEKAEFERDTDGGSPTLHSKALSEISQLETELKKTIYNHSRLIGETTELSQLSDQIINRAKLRKLRPVFDFKQALNTIMKLDQPDLLAHVLEPLFAPRMDKYFTMRNIDNILTLRSDEKQETEKIEKRELTPDFKYEDEILEEKIGRNFAFLFLEIKFGEEIYTNRDYYAFLVHLSGKRSYRVDEMLEKQETMLEEMVVEHLTEEE